MDLYCPCKPVPCKNAQRGCEQLEIPRDKLAAHEEKCEFRAVFCKMPLCDYEVGDSSFANKGEGWADFKLGTLVPSRRNGGTYENLGE